MSNDTLNEAELESTRNLIMMVARSAQFIPTEDVVRWLNTISRSETLGPLLYPTEYINGGASNLEEQRAIAEGFLAFRKAIDKVREMGAKRYGQQSAAEKETP